MSNVYTCTCCTIYGVDQAFFAFLAHLSRRLIGELIVYEGIRRPFTRPSVVCQHFQTTCPLNREANSSHISQTASIGLGNKKLCFYSNPFRTLVAMETYSSHRLIRGKVEIDNFFCLIGDIWIFFLQKCLLSSPLRFIRLLSKWVNLISCRGGRKGQFL